MSNPVRLGIVGIGNMGNGHAQNILQGKIPRMVLGAVCDTNPEMLKRCPNTPGFATHQEMLASGKIDAVLVATPHYDHTTIGIDAIKAGIHTLIEKPLSVHKADCQKLIAAYEARSRKDLVFAEMFNQRTDPRYRKLRDLLQSGELGAIRRVNWIITDWYRTEAYYASGGWRATWAGEGGGVLMNQCPHNLDLFQWICGMPSRVRAFCGFGKHHHIEVEDDVTAYLEYANGATGVFITSTGEAPGVNRLEVIGDHGRLVLEHGKITWFRVRTPVGKLIRETEESFPHPEVWNVDIPASGGEQHKGILKNWTAAILEGKPLLAKGEEGINGLMLGNAMLLSAWTNGWVDVPVDEDLYYAKLQERIATSTFKKGEVRKSSGAGLEGSFGGVR